MPRSTTLFLLPPKRRFGLPTSRFGHGFNGCDEPLRKDDQSNRTTIFSKVAASLDSRQAAR
jgi:hypothetical protein